MSISNSELTNNSADYDGGAIRVDTGSSVSISNIVLTNNVANDGGVIAVFRSSTLIIKNTDITNNIVSLIILQSKVTFTGGINILSNSGPIYAFNSRVESTTLSNNRGELG